MGLLYIALFVTVDMKVVIDEMINIRGRDNECDFDRAYEYGLDILRLFNYLLTWTKRVWNS